MTYSLTWLPDVLRNAGLKVSTVAGWETRGLGDVGDTLGVLCHHTVGAKTGNMPSLRGLTNGRKANPAKGVTALRGPLAQLGLGRDGTYYVIAAGFAQHAGTGSWQGISTGNTNFIGIEAENTGSEDDEWPAVQMDAYHRGVAAMLKFIGRGPEFCAAHKEWAPKRKPFDPRFDMDVFRAAVAAIMNGTAPAPALIRPVDDKGRPTLRRGATGSAVARLQTRLIAAEVLIGTPHGQPLPEIFGPRTEAAVRRFQRLNDLVPDGIVGPKTWAVLER